MPEESPRRVATRTYQRTGQHFYEPLGDDIQLDMVLIPAGTFMMGSAADEKEAYPDEYPEHEVVVPEFFMGRTPVTQIQWRVVAGYEPVDHQLEPAPSYFKGGDRPVEQVNWDDAQEFCKRLTNRTGHLYRLPSEAEWEYACRAGTTTPFHFGHHISTELANYDGSEYWESPAGESKGETTNVWDYPPNPWGLQDMTGNVWEWCEDDWHGDYKVTPIDGSAWIVNEQTSERRKLIRGGSWFRHPKMCRSAFRAYDPPKDHFNYLGFRVVCSS